VPGASTRKNQRIALMAAGAAAALLVVLGLQSIHARNVREAEQAREGLPIATAAAAPAPPNEPPMSPVNAIAAAAPATPEPAEPGAASATAIDAPAPGADTLGAASATPAAPAVDGHEKMLDVKTDLHSRSPLVRDAQRALLKGDTARAIALAQQAVATNSADADGWLTLAAARKASGDGSGARDAYTQCIAKGYTVGVMSCRALAAQATAGAAPTAPAKGSW
jgi:hypothetical protein